ncbi:MAG TPA: CDP-alcohol phosphatidyltransferase family protein [Kofleriaceae bacterium]|nr:CDP-alcohol phosphatidyltransferase family protein [Kofleriaceae bacterium]
MTDATISWITGALWLVLFGAYAIRVRKVGAYRSERAAGVGSTVVMGQNIMQATYWAIEPVVRGLVRLRLTANAVTTIALVLGVGAGAAVAFGEFGLACLLATLSTLSDILDGQVARYTRTGSPTGELYDAAVDRYTEFAFIAGFIVYAHATGWLVVLALLALHASFMISHASARAEALEVDVPRGLMRRHERAACLTLVSGLTPLLGPPLHAQWPALPPTAIFAIGLALVATLGGWSAIVRLARIQRAARRAS